MTRRNGRGPDSSLKRLWIFIYLARRRFYNSRDNEGKCSACAQSHPLEPVPRERTSMVPQYGSLDLGVSGSELSAYFTDAGRKGER